MVSLSTALGVALTLAGLVGFGSAAPPVQVSLLTSFPEPPLLVELLETAASQHSQSYHSLLGRIAVGYWDHLKSDREVYSAFVDLFQDDPHFSDPHALELFELAFSIRSAAPRIAAHYQFYTTTVGANSSTKCSTWIDGTNGPICEIDGIRFGGSMPESTPTPFDRIVGNPDTKPVLTLYTDLVSSTFADFYLALTKAIEQNLISVRVRYLPPTGLPQRPFKVQGYGAQLALKKTDYLVIDDRSATTDGDNKPVKMTTAPTEKQIRGVSLQAASYVVDRKRNPLDAFVDLTQNFPSHLATLIDYPISDLLLDELRDRPSGLAPGYNGFWVNGLQIKLSDVNPFSLVKLFQTEQRYIRSLGSLGLGPADAIKLISDERVNYFYANPSPQRFDTSDKSEGGNVVLWMNDIESDPMYRTWSPQLRTLMMPSRSDQMPPIRKELHQIIVPVDLASASDIELVTGKLQDIIRRRVPVRIGIVPLLSSELATRQAAVYYYLRDLHGNTGALTYLKACLHDLKACLTSSDIFQSVLRQLDPADAKPVSLANVLDSNSATAFVARSSIYLDRLGLAGPTFSAISFVNGVVVARDRNWFRGLQAQITWDLNVVQRAVYEGRVQQDAWLPSLFYVDAASRRNGHIVPEDAGNIKIVNLVKLTEKAGLDVVNLPRIPSTDSTVSNQSAQLILATDFDTTVGRNLCRTAVNFGLKNDQIELVFLHTGTRFGWEKSSSRRLWLSRDKPLSHEDVLSLASQPQTTDDDVSTAGSEDTVAAESWVGADSLMSGFGLAQHSSALILNGRVVMIPDTATIQPADLDALLSYERRRRLGPIYEAANGIGLLGRVVSSVTDFARLTSVVALATTPPPPSAHVLDEPSVGRVSFFDELPATHSAFSVGKHASAKIHITVLVDPATEQAQHWAGILKSLSHMKGVFIRVFFNPHIELKEIPVNRFYRYLAEPQVRFSPKDGKLIEPSIQFGNMPANTLLTAGLDVPASWLIAAKESVHDPDNLSLGNADTGTVDIVYELESILIDGHARDSTQENFARGVQLILSTDDGRDISDTIVMANLGYFQLQANPGHFQIRLKDGPSRRVFQLESMGGLDDDGVLPGDDHVGTVSVIDFQGATLFPSLARRPGMESVDVVLPLVEPDTFLARARGHLSWIKDEFVQALTFVGFRQAPPVTALKPRHADINIFSVASGHLYERMLNIMIVSVMRHTNHTVKFWFIEQFLSPSFKEFIPHMAAAYGFEYEMVTYKWPHWLRGQREKQREIWGYKILFLDVLFPLDLDKVIFVDADQIVRTDMKELIDLDLHQAPYGFTPMCDSRESMEGFRFWKTGYWKNFLRGRPYHISALYVVDLARFRILAGGDKLRQQYQRLSADPQSLSNLDQDLPNNMQFSLEIFSLPQEWLWCETWCSDESLESAKTIDLCNNPQTREPKLDRARRQVPEWTEYDDEIAALASRVKGVPGGGMKEVEADRSRADSPRDEL